LVVAAAQGKRGAAWRLLHWIGEDNREALEAIRICSDARLFERLLEWLALGTWAGKPFKVPLALRQPPLRNRVRALFLSAAPAGLSQQVLLGGLRDARPALNAEAAHLLGMLGESAVPTLLEAARSPEAGARWHALRLLGSFHERRGLPIMVQALADHDYSVAWMAARTLSTMGTPVVRPILHLLSTAPLTPWLMETSAYALHAQHHPQLRSFLEPVLRAMRSVEYRIEVPLAVEHALATLPGS
jgi:HEAT repeat protein